MCGYVTVVRLRPGSWDGDASVRRERARTSGVVRARRPTASVPPLPPLTVSDGSTPPRFPIGFRRTLTLFGTFWPWVGRWAREISALGLGQFGVGRVFYLHFGIRSKNKQLFCNNTVY